MMQANLFIPVTSIEEALHFYISELALFDIKADYGMDTYLVSYNYNPSFGLNLTVGSPISKSGPLYELVVADCVTEFKRIANIAFSKGGLVNANRDSKNIFEYPLGKNFLMEDPSGHKFLISEYFTF
jgi:hypothetical protein